MKRSDETCPYCDKPVSEARSRFLEASISPFAARLVSVPKSNSQGWFHWHPSCAEKSIAKLYKRRAK